LFFKIGFGPTVLAGEVSSPLTLAGGETITGTGTGIALDSL